jgi:DNA-binding transcriptional ArsR family regulator
MEEAQVLFRPMRLRILDALAEPNTASEVARRLGVARQKINYHLKELERDGLVELVQERKKGNCLERIVRATARSYLVGAEALGALAREFTAAPDRFSSTYLISRLAAAISDLATMKREAEEQTKRLATFALEVDVRFRDARERNAFLTELATQTAELAAKYHDGDAPHGRTTRMLLAGFPARGGGSKEPKP